MKRDNAETRYDGWALRIIICGEPIERMIRGRIATIRSSAILFFQFLVSWKFEQESKTRGRYRLTRLIRSIDRESSFEENKKKIPRSIELDKIVYHKPDSSSLDRVWRVTLVSRIYRRELIEDGENASRLLSLLESLRFVIDRIGILSKKDRDTRGTSYERS